METLETPFTEEKDQRVLAEDEVIVKTGKTVYVFTTHYPDENPPNTIADITRVLDKTGLLKGVDCNP